MRKYNLDTKRIRFKHKNLIKAKDIKIIVAGGKTYIEAVPEKNKDALSLSEISEMYTSFIRLGRDLYNSNKGSINKIVIGHNIIKGRLDNRLLVHDEDFNEVNKKISDWLRENKQDKADLRAYKRTHLNYLILNNEEWKPSESLISWLKSNYIPDIYEAENNNGKYVMYDDGFMIDLAIFMYLTIYSIYHIKGEIKNEVCFEDYIKFIDIDTIHFDVYNYMHYLFDIINLYEVSHIHILHGYDRIFNDTDNEYGLIREYESIYGVLWYIFKMNINDLLLTDSKDRIIKIQPCKGKCGRLVFNNPRCYDCQTIENNRRKRKSEQNKKNGLKEVEKLISKNIYPDKTLSEAKNLINTRIGELKMNKIKEVLNKLKETN